MAFLDKLNDLAKNIGDKTGDVIETNRINLKIASDRKEVNALMQKIGEYYYGKYKKGEIPPEEIKDYFAAADEKNLLIAEAQTEIERIKTADAAAKPAEENQDAPSDKLACPGCGAMYDPGKRFCGECGCQLD